MHSSVDARTPAVPIYFPITFRSASLILSCQPLSGLLKVIKNVPVNSQRDKLLGIRDSRRFGGSSAGFVVAALNAASAASREVVVLRVLSAGIIMSSRQNFT